MEECFVKAMGLTEIVGSNGAPLLAFMHVIILLSELIRFIKHERRKFEIS